jgi:hypothetical protein
MVKKMLVVFSAVALMIGTVGAACAFMPGMAVNGDMIMVPMKVKTTYVRSVGEGDVSSFFMDGCNQYTGTFRPWGTWTATTCTMKTQVVPPKCVAPAGMGAVALGAPPMVAPGSKLISNTETYEMKAPGLRPCVDGPTKYEVVKKQVVK